MTQGRQWVYRLVAAGIPALLGLAVMVWVLFQRGWVSVDKDTGRIVLQRPPLYLQEPGHEVKIKEGEDHGNKFKDDIIELKPNIYGIGIDLKAPWHSFISKG